MSQELEMVTDDKLKLVKFIDLLKLLRVIWVVALSISIGATFGLAFDYLLVYYRAYKLPYFAIITPGIVNGTMYGWLGGLISNYILNDFGIIGSSLVGVVGATIPVLCSKPVS